MEELFTQLFQQYGYLSLSVLIFAETVFPPIPSEAILLMGGFLTVRSGMSVVLSLLFATLGSVLGALVLYSVGRMLSVDRIYSFCGSKIGRVIGLKVKDIEKANAWFEKYEYAAVLLCRFVPVVRSIISLPAGISKMKISHFVLLSALGSAVWNGVLLLLGSYAGAEWERILRMFNTYGRFILIGLIFAFVLSVCLYIFKKRQ